MGKKRKKTQSAEAKPTRSFQEYLSEATLSKLRPFIQQQVHQLGTSLLQEQQQTLRALYTRIVTLERFLMDKFDLHEDHLPELLASIEDEAAGLEKVEVVSPGDVVRIEVSTKTKDQDSFAGSSRMVVEGCGVEPYTLGPEIEPKLIGLKTGDVADIEFGVNKGMLARIVINRISRRAQPVASVDASPVTANSSEPETEESVA